MEIVPFVTGYLHVPGHRVERYGVVTAGPVIVVAYLVRVDGLTVLFDSGIAADEEALGNYWPQVFPLDDQLAAHGVAREEVDLIVNCHLHADHAGGNHRFPDVPVLVQADELRAARNGDYTIPTACIDYPGARLTVIEDEHRLARHARIVRLPGHSPGHQGLLLEDGDRTVLLAGQALDEASQFATAWLGWHTDQVDPRSDVTYPAWMARLAQEPIDFAVFAHDTAVWQRPRLPDRAGLTPRPWPS